MSSQVPTVFKGFGVDKAENWSKPQLVEFEAKKINDKDVVIEVECCGVCGSDVHTVRGDWGPLNRPDLVVGHEIVGKVVKVGEKVSSVKLGDRVGIGAQCGACSSCEQCSNDNAQYCSDMVSTYNSEDKESNYITQGGYANYAIAKEDVVFNIPDSLPSAYAAPMLCGGLTVFSPLVRTLGYDLTGKSVGIIGIGGLGHMAIQFASALGADVTAISRSNSKKEQAKEMGATDFIATGEDKEWASHNTNKFDLLLNCATSFTSIDFGLLLSTLKVSGSFISVGAPSAEEQITVPPFLLIFKNLKISGSLIGSPEEARKMLQIAADHSIRPWIEEVSINAESCGKALQRCYDGDVRYRFVFVDYDKAFA